MYCWTMILTLSTVSLPLMSSHNAYMMRQRSTPPCFLKRSSSLATSASNDSAAGSPLGGGLIILPLEDRPDHTPRIPVSAERRRVDVGGIILEVLRFAEPPHAFDEPGVSARGERGAGNQRVQEKYVQKAQGAGAEATIGASLYAVVR